MSVSYNRVKYYSLGKPYYDNKITLPYPDCFEITNLTIGYSQLLQKYYRQGQTITLQGRTPYVDDVDVVCSQLQYLTYISEDKKNMFVYCNDVINGSVSFYTLISNNVNVPINWNTCGSVKTFNSLFFFVFDLVYPDWVRTEGGYSFPKEGTNLISPTDTMTINYLSC